VHFVVPCGTTGETPTLSGDERRRVVALVAEAVDGRAKVLAGAGGYDTRGVIRAVGECEQAGAHGILSVTPYYNKPSQEGLFQHYRAIAESTELPVIIYNVPGRTGCNVEPATLARLAAIPNIVGVKEATGNMMQMTEICRVVPPEFLVLSGDDYMTVPLMAIGGRGIVSVVANEVPAEMVQLVEAAERGDFTAARRWHAKLLPLMQVNFVESNPIPVKFAMAAMGLCEETYRLPLVPPSHASQAKILSVLREFGLPVVAAA
jgi:4-hydroxy-tetrahydrodipicolinate synthase